MSLTAGTTLGPYEIVDLLGKGGMGEVYRAHDRRLDRDVALKVMSDAVSHDAMVRTRFEREAKAVAALSHPNIVSIFDFSKEGDLWFAVTELLEGETLRERLSRAPVTGDEAMRIAREVTAGLAVAHDRGIVHRDLKPENVFLTRDGGVKILDFGLAVVKKAPQVEDEKTEIMMTQEGQIIGTVSYMSPEQLRSERITPASDIFSLGCLLYECVAGRRPFRTGNSVETIASILKDDPAPLAEPPELAPVIMRCLEKEPAARFATARDVRTALANPSAATAAPNRPTRVLVLPFRMLRRDDNLEFLAYSLPDAIIGSLAGINSLIVRSSLASSQYANAPLDLAKIATEQDVNAIVSGTILTSGDRLRVSAQLTELPAATVKWSHVTETSLDDIFGVQDELTRKIVRSVSGTINESDSRVLRKDVPQNATAYEFFLRANQQAHVPEGWVVARDLYRRSVEEDPHFAPAWARLGRVYFLLSKYTDDPADNARLADETLRRAIELNPDLSLAHRYYAELEIEREKTVESMQRLMERVHLRPNDIDLGAALGKALRYAGLLHESLEVFRKVRELDPRMPTGIVHTYFMLGDYEAAHAAIKKDIFYMEPLTLAMLGREEEAIAFLRNVLTQNVDRQFRAYHESLFCMLTGDRDGASRAADVIAARNPDPEALFYMARSFAHIGRVDRALELLERVVRSFFPVVAFERDPWLAAAREHPRFAGIVETARAHHAEARTQWHAGALAGE